MNSYIGIDPGASGGIAVISVRCYGLRSCNVITVSKMPKDEVSMWAMLKCISDSTLGCCAVIEQVWPRPGNGVSGMFKFGVNYGLLRMALVGCGIPFETVTPMKWQKELGVSTRGKKESKMVWKNRLKGIAEKKFPGEKITLATADALLLADYCRRAFGGKDRSSTE